MIEIKLRDSVLAIGQVLADFKCEDVVSLQLPDSASNFLLLDYYLVATCSSLVHVRGVLSHLRKLCYGESAEGIFGCLDLTYIPQRIENPSWCLLDFGPVVLHLMSRDSRDFYDIDSLWSWQEVVHLSECS